MSSKKKIYCKYRESGRRKKENAATKGGFSDLIFKREQFPLIQNHDATKNG
jgi:hypothetical protein